MVRVQVRCATGPDETWPALADPDRLARWFGDLTPGWRPGSPARIEMGDGDFFDATVDRVEPGRAVAFRWRFLGLGPVAAVRWQLTADPDGSVVTVTDDQPDRTPAETGAMTAGWTDFLDRLARHLRTGEPTRYGQRDAIDGAVDLPPDAPDPLRPDVIDRWLPIATDGFVPRWFFVVDDEGPRRFRLDGWRSDPDTVRFRVEISAPTRCVLRLDRLRGGRRLSFEHTGWNGTGAQHRALRRRFTATWVAALARAAGREGT